MVRGPALEGTAVGCGALHALSEKFPLICIAAGQSRFSYRAGDGIRRLASQASSRYPAVLPGRMTGIEPALSAWEAVPRSTPSSQVSLAFRPHWGVWRAANVRPPGVHPLAAATRA
jgi:hypothetical protein